jgi:hypothetical protein
MVDDVLVTCDDSGTNSRADNRGRSELQPQVLLLTLPERGHGQAWRLQGSTDNVETSLRDVPAIGARGGGRKKEEMREHEGKMVFFACLE